MSFESLPWTVDDDGGFFSHQWCDLKIVLYKLTGHFNYFFFCLFSLSSYKPNSNGDNIYYYFYISFYYLSLFFLSLNNLLLCERQSVVSDSLRLHGLYSPSNTWTIQSRILEWVAIPFSRGSSQPRDRTQVSCIAGGFLTSWATIIVLECLHCAYVWCCRLHKHRFTQLYNGNN